jgi:hypothetical protein
MALLFLMSGCTLCRDEILNQSISPDGKWSAKTVLRDCGATTAETNLVYLQPAGTPAKKLGDVVVVVRHDHGVGLSWSDNKTLVVDCTGCGNDVRVHRESADGIAILVLR